MEIKYAQSKGKLYIYLNGELDEYTAGRAKSEIENAIASTGNIKCVVFNFANTSFMDSTGIGVLISKYKQLKGADSRLYVRKPSKSIDKIFNMAGLYSIMPKIS